jgi:dsRNA-specific ribonuclease
MSVRKQATFALLGFCLLSSIVHCTNKESYELLEENFSKEETINFSGICRQLHYEFKEQGLLIDALYPLLPKVYQHPKKNFEHLEFLGDSVLGLLARERILQTFPNETRDINNKLYTSLICNKTLTSIFLKNLEIECFIPYPGKRTCEYCNIVEAIIGAIYKDDLKRGLINARKFVMNILNDHVLNEKWEELYNSTALRKKFVTKEQGSFTSRNAVQRKQVVDHYMEGQSLEAIHTKTLLSMISSRLIEEQPQYSFHLGRNPEGLPGFIAIVKGAHIGHIEGFGTTRNAAEQEAARCAINFLIQEEYIPVRESIVKVHNYTTFINEYCLSQSLSLNFKHTYHNQPFKFEVIIGDKVMGQGSGNSKNAARDNAAQEAYNFLVKENILKPLAGSTNKNYRSILNEAQQEGRIVDYKLVEVTSVDILPAYTVRVTINEAMVEGVGSSKEEAQENACKEAFEEMLEQQEQSMKRKEALKTAAKRPGKVTVYAKKEKHTN